VILPGLDAPVFGNLKKRGMAMGKDAVACFMETEERRKRGRHSPLEGRLCIKRFLGQEKGAS
jgi:hypothetical protein